MQNLHRSSNRESVDPSASIQRSQLSPNFFETRESHHSLSSGPHTLPNRRGSSPLIEHRLSSGRPRAGSMSRSGSVCVSRDFARMPMEGWHSGSQNRSGCPRRRSSLTNGPDLRHSREPRMRKPSGLLSSLPIWVVRHSDLRLNENLPHNRLASVSRSPVILFGHLTEQRATLSHFKN